MWLPHKTCDKTKLCTNVCTYNKNTNYIQALTTRIPYTGGNCTVINLMCLAHQIYQSSKFNFWSCFLLIWYCVLTIQGEMTMNTKYIKNLLLYPFSHSTYTYFYMYTYVILFYYIMHFVSSFMKSL